MFRNQEEYEISKLIGEGSFGKVYTVKRQSDQQILVQKQINMKALKPQEKKQCLDEAQILQKLCHPNIIKFIDAQQNFQSQLFIYTEYAEGGDLEKYIEKVRKRQIGILLEEDQVLSWFVQICLGLKYLHDRKIIHRDLKTSNVFLSNNYQTAKIGDFGLAKVLKNTNHMASTICGTFLYFSPEIVKNQPYNFKSDI